MAAHCRNALSQMLLEQGNFKPESEEWAGAKVALASAVTAEEIQSLHAQLQQTFLRTGAEAAALEAELAEEQDRSVANDNAAGLRGGGAAIEQVRTMIAKSRPGYIGMFRLSCLDVVGERFGQEGIQDCLMAVSAFLIENLRAEDSVYHWSESSLLAVCDRKIREDILSAELNRVLQRNRDFTIQIGGSTIMLRIPIELELFPIDAFQSADDLQKIPAKRGRGDRALSEKAAARLLTHEKARLAEHSELRASHAFLGRFGNTCRCVSRSARGVYGGRCRGDHSRCPRCGLPVACDVRGGVDRPLATGSSFPRDEVPARQVGNSCGI